MMIRHFSVMLLSLAGLAAVASAQPVDVELRFDEPARVEWVTGDAVEIVWAGLEDSRCPEGAPCAWEGEVTVFLAVAVNGSDPDTVSITLHVGDEDKARALVQDMNDIQLLGVAPYPVVEVVTERSEYRARLEVSRRRSTAVEASGWGGIKEKLAAQSKRN